MVGGGVDGVSTDRVRAELLEEGTSRWQLAWFERGSVNLTLPVDAPPAVLSC